MKQALVLIALVAATLGAGYALAGFAAVFTLVYGAIALMAAMIAATFFWLWAVRATPLALGMAVSWSGIALVTGWGWLFELMGRPGWAVGHPAVLALLALYVVGAVLHFAVIHRSFGRHGAGFLWPVAVSVGLSVLAFVVV